MKSRCVARGENVLHAMHEKKPACVSRISQNETGNSDSLRKWVFKKSPSYRKPKRVLPRTNREDLLQLGGVKHLLVAFHPERLASPEIRCNKSLRSCNISAPQICACLHQGSGALESCNVSRLVAVRVRLVGAAHGHVNVVSLLLRENGELRAKRGGGAGQPSRRAPSEASTPGRACTCRCRAPSRARAGRESGS